MYEELLRECGLTQNESLVYLALLKIGKSKSGVIVKKAKVSGGKIYETLYKLIEKGLVISVTENNVKYFIANEPNTLVFYIEERKKLLQEKEEKLKKVLPQFNLLKKQKEYLDNVSLVRGFKGISSLVNKYLENAKDIKIMGVVSSKKEVYNDFWRRWHLKRVSLKKKAEIILSDKKADYAKFFDKLSYTKVREFNRFTPSAIMIIDNEVFIFSYEDDFLCIYISSESVSRSFVEFFKGLWSIGK